MEIMIMHIAINFQAHFLSQVQKTKLMPDIKKISHKYISFKHRKDYASRASIKHQQNIYKIQLPTKISIRGSI